MSVQTITATGAVVAWRALAPVATGPVGGALLGYVVNVSSASDATGCDWVVGCRALAAATSCSLAGLALGEAYLVKVVPVYDWGAGSGCSGTHFTQCPSAVFRTAPGLPAAPPIALTSLTSASASIRVGPLPLARTGGFPVLSYAVAVSVGGAPHSRIVIDALSAPAGGPVEHLVSSLPARAQLAFSVQATTGEGTGPAAWLSASTCGNDEHGDVIVAGTPACTSCPIERTCNGSSVCALPGYSGALCTMCEPGYYRPECTSPCAPCPASAWVATAASAALVAALAVFIMRKQPFSLTLGANAVGFR